MINFGIVQDITDPEKLGKVKVKVFHAHDNIETKDLGWSQVMMPSNTPAVSGKGHSVNLNATVLWKEGEVLPAGISVGDIKTIGSLVCGMFLDAQWQEFIVMGSLPTKTDGVEDNNVRVRGEANPHAADPVGLYQPPSTYAPIYPYNNVYETESGHVKEYDDTPGVERITERHKSGTRYEIDPNGTKNETIVRDNYKLVAGHDTLEVYGNVKIIVGGDVDIAVTGSITANVGGNVDIDAVGNITIDTTGDESIIDINATGASSQIDVDSIGTLKLKSTGTTNIESTADMTLKSTNIKLDGDVAITGNVVVTGTTTTSGSQVVDSHIHTHGDPAGNTSALS